MHGYLTVSHEYGLLQWSELDFFFFFGGIFKICLFHVLVMFSFDSKFSLQVRSLCLPRSPPLLQCLGRPDLTSQWEEKAGRRQEDIHFSVGSVPPSARGCPAQLPRTPRPYPPRRRRNSATSRCPPAGRTRTEGGSRRPTSPPSALLTIPLAIAYGLCPTKKKKKKW